MLQYSIVTIEKGDRDQYYIVGDYSGTDTYKLYPISFMPGNIVRVSLSNLYLDYENMYVSDFENMGAVGVGSAPVVAKIVLVAHSMETLVQWFAALGFKVSTEGMINPGAAGEFLQLLNKKRSTIITFPAKK